MSSQFFHLRLPSATKRSLARLQDQTSLETGMIVLNYNSMLIFIELPRSNLVTDLMTTIETNLQIRYSSNAADPRTTLVLRRSIKALNGIVFEFTTIRMLTGVATLKNVSSSPRWLFPKLNDVGFKLFTYLHQPLWKYYETISSPFASTLNPDSIALPRTAEDLLLAHLIYEAVFHLTTWLWQRHGKDGKDEFEGLRPWVCGIA